MERKDKEVKSVEKRTLNAMNWKFDPKIHAQRFKQKSLTVPNGALTIRQIMDRHVNGLGVPIQSPLGFDSMASFDGPDVEKLTDQDLVDRQLFIDSLAGHMVTQEKQLKELHDKKLAEIHAEREKMLKFQAEFAEFQKAKQRKEELEKP